MSTRTSTARVAAARPRSPLPFPRAPQVKRLACCDVPCQGRGAHAMPRDAHTSPKSVRGQVAYEDVRRSRRLQREGRVVIAACLRREKVKEVKGGVIVASLRRDTHVHQRRSAAVAPLFLIPVIYLTHSLTPTGHRTLAVLQTMILRLDINL